jgi:hypothetical protein
VFRSDDGGRSWQSVGLEGRLITAVTASPVERDVVWVGTEPSEVWHSGNAERLGQFDAQSPQAAEFLLPSRS